MVFFLHHRHHAVGAPFMSINTFTSNIGVLQKRTNEEEEATNYCVVYKNRLKDDNKILSYDKQITEPIKQCSPLYCPMPCVK
jgi:hypothetical protein